MIHTMGTGERRPRRRRVERLADRQRRNHHASHDGSAIRSPRHMRPQPKPCEQHNNASNGRRDQRGQTGEPSGSTGCRNMSAPSPDTKKHPSAHPSQGRRPNARATKNKAGHFTEDGRRGGHDAAPTLHCGLISADRSAPMRRPRPGRPTVPAALVEAPAAQLLGALQAVGDRCSGDDERCGGLGVAGSR